MKFIVDILNYKRKEKKRKERERERERERWIFYVNSSAAYTLVPSTVLPPIPNKFVF